MNFAIVELKYVVKGMYIVPLGNIQSSKPKVSTTDPYFCYISADVTEEPNFDAKYHQKFDGTPGVFKVFIRKITNTFEEAATYLKEKRMQTVPKKYRQPSNTDSELKTTAAKKKKVQKQILRVNKKNANTKNASHLAEILAAADSSAITVASEFEELVQRTLDEFSDSDTESNHPLQSFQSIASASNARSDALHESKLTQSQPEPISKLKKDFSLLCTSKSAIASPPSNSRTLPLQLAYQNPQRITMNKSSTGIRFASNPYIATGKENQTDASKNVIVTPVSVHSNGTNMKEALVNTTRDIRLKEAFSTSKDENNLVGTVPSQILAESKQVQMKRKMSMETGVISVAQKLKCDDHVTHKQASVTEYDMSAKNNYQFHAEPKSDNNLPNPKVVFEVSEIINIDELVKQKGALGNENVNLKSENKLLKERNAALQNALVSASKSAAQVPFEEEDGGRRYNNHTERTKNVFLNSVQCKILDAINDHRAFLNNLVLAVFGAKTLKISSVTGRPSNRTKGPSKPALDPTKLKFIYDSMEARTNKCPQFSRTKINKIITKKIANLAGVGKKRHKKRTHGVKNVVELNETGETHSIDEVDARFTNSPNDSDFFVKANETEETIHLIEEVGAHCSKSPYEPDVANESDLLNSPNDITFSDNNLDADSIIIDIFDLEGELNDLSGLVTYNFLNSIEN